jgi:hypothetical protein
VSRAALKRMSQPRAGSIIALTWELERVLLGDERAALSNDPNAENTGGLQPPTLAGKVTRNDGGGTTVR